MHVQQISTYPLLLLATSPSSQHNRAVTKDSAIIVFNVVYMETPDHVAQAPHCPPATDTAPSEGPLQFLFVPAAPQVGVAVESLELLQLLHKTLVGVYCWAGLLELSQGFCVADAGVLHEVAEDYCCAARDALCTVY